MRPFQRTIQFHASGCVDTVAPARPALVSWREGGELSCGGHHHHHLHQRGWRHPLSRLHTNRFRQRVTLCLQVNKQLFLARFTLKQATISWLLEDLLVISCKQILICFFFLKLTIFDQVDILRHLQQSEFWFLDRLTWVLWFSFMLQTVDSWCWC